VKLSQWLHSNLTFGSAPICWISNIWLYQPDHRNDRAHSPSVRSPGKCGPMRFAALQRSRLVRALSRIKYETRNRIYFI
jgi:hypothetical protein